MPRRYIGVGDAAEYADAGIVHQDVEAAELLDGSLNRMRRVIGVSNVGDRCMNSISAASIPA